MLGDSYGAAVVEALSRRELEKMDGEDSRLKEGGAGGQDEEALIGVYKSASTGSNGSAVKVREVGGHLIRYNLFSNHCERSFTWNYHNHPIFHHPQEYTDMQSNYTKCISSFSRNI